MAEKKKFIYGLIVGIVIVLVFDIIYLGAGPLVKKIEDDNGIQVVEEGYETPNSKINDIIHYIDDKFYQEDYDKDQLRANAYRGLVDTLDDRYSDYFTKEQYESFMESSAGEYQGIGAVVNFNEETKEIMIVSPFIGSPAEKAGLLPGDIIKKVDGEDIMGLSLEEVVQNKIRGEKDTKVLLTVYRPEEKENIDGESEEKVIVEVKEEDFIDIEIVRDVISEPTVSYEMLEDKMGYIRVTGFEEVTYRQFKEALVDLEKQGQEGVIIDLRNNPGGLLNIVIDMADELLPEGLIVYTEDKEGNRQVAYSDNKKQLKKPLVVLVNENSASASEILAGAVKDSGIGTLVGTTTFGKGLVQRVFPLEDGSAIKLTIAKYYTPSGNYIHDKGITPDVKVELPEEWQKYLTVPREEDTQLDKAIEVLQEKIKENKVVADKE